MANPSPLPPTPHPRLSGFWMALTKKVFSSPWTVLIRPFKISGNEKFICSALMFMASFDLWHFSTFPCFPFDNLVCNFQHVWLEVCHLSLRAQKDMFITSAMHWQATKLCKVQKSWFAFGRLCSWTTQYNPWVNLTNF